RRASPCAPLGTRLVSASVAPFPCILAVLGSILAGTATPTEAASVGAVGTILLAIRKAGANGLLLPVMVRTTQITSMIFVILVGATVFSLVFRGLGRGVLINHTLSNLSG